MRKFVGDVPFNPLSVRVAAKAGDQFLPIQLGPPRSTSLKLDNIEAEKPVAHDQRDVDGMSRLKLKPLVGRLKQRGEPLERRARNCRLLDFLLHARSGINLIVSAQPQNYKDSI